MLVADAYLGNTDDPVFANLIEDGDPLRIVVDDTERRRSRFRTTTECGREIGVVIGRELRDGDVLEAQGTPVIVGLEPVEAMILDFTSADVPLTTALEVGHTVGNRHWDLAVREESILIPATSDRKLMETTVAALLDAGVELAYRNVPPTVFDEDGSGAVDSHSHSHEHGQGHSHSHPHDHDHISLSEGGHGHAQTTRGDDSHHGDTDCIAGDEEPTGTPNE